MNQSDMLCYMENHNKRTSYQILLVGLLGINVSANMDTMLNTGTEAIHLNMKPLRISSDRQLLEIRKKSTLSSMFFQVHTKNS